MTILACSYCRGSLSGAGPVCWGAMRIIAGTLRSRPLQAPPGLATRPTSDRLRETLFNVLAPRMEGALFLDLYAGSGAVGIEALSRGAQRAVFVEHAAGALKVLRANLARLGLESGFEIDSGTVTGYLRKEIWTPGFDIIFLDPPYDAADQYHATLGLLGGEVRGLLRAGAVVIAEHRRKEVLAESYGQLRRSRLLRQGDAALSFYAANEPQIQEHGGKE
jgi:16S rRNA (guanine966-N2)-methyltransferase